MVRPSRGHSGAQQDQGVDQRQMPWIKGLDPCGGPDTVNRGAIRTHWVHRVFKEGPEPSGKEHDLGHDEQDKAISQADLHNGRVIHTAIALGGDFGPPTVHHVQHQNQADEEHVRGHFTHPEHGSEQHDERTN